MKDDVSFLPAQCLALSSFTPVLHCMLQCSLLKQKICCNVNFPLGWNAVLITATWKLLWYTLLTATLPPMYGLILWYTLLTATLPPMYKLTTGKAFVLD